VKLKAQELVKGSNYQSKFHRKIYILLLAMIVAIVLTIEIGMYVGGGQTCLYAYLSVQRDKRGLTRIWRIPYPGNSMGKAMGKSGVKEVAQEGVCDQVLR